MAAVLIIAAVVAGLIVLLFVWRVQPPVSTLMLARSLSGRPVVRDWTPLARVAPALAQAVIMSEDSRFCRHHGVDWGALREVLADADEDGPARGASTITMQVAKNLFLWPGRSIFRKGLEIPLALLIDVAWPKRRVLEVYLNIAEWGPDGVFGAQAGAAPGVRVKAADLSTHEAALMTALLPNPVVRDPRRPSRGLARITARIAARARGAAPWTDCLGLPGSPSSRASPPFRGEGGF